MRFFLNIYIILLLIIFIIILKCALQKDKLDLPNKIYDLQKDGFVVIKNVLTNTELKELQNNCYENNYNIAKQSLIHNNYLLNNIRKYIKDNNYEFQDYIWIIKKSSVHTCHRDNNGDFFNKNQKFPSYTLLVYLEDSEKCLGVVPYSHNNMNSYNILSNSYLL